LKLYIILTTGKQDPYFGNSKGV